MRKETANLLQLIRSIYQKMLSQSKGPEKIWDTTRYAVKNQCKNKQEKNYFMISYITVLINNHVSRNKKCNRNGFGQLPLVKEMN